MITPKISLNSLKMNKGVFSYNEAVVRDYDVIYDDKYNSLFISVKSIDIKSVLKMLRKNINCKGFKKQSDICLKINGRTLTIQGFPEHLIDNLKEYNTYLIFKIKEKVYRKKIIF